MKRRRPYSFSGLWSSNTRIIWCEWPDWNLWPIRDCCWTADSNLAFPRKVFDYKWLEWFRINGPFLPPTQLLSFIIPFSSISRQQFFSDSQLFKLTQWEDCRRRQQLTGERGGTTDQLEAKEPNISQRTRHRPNSQLTVSVWILNYV